MSQQIITMASTGMHGLFYVLLLFFSIQTIILTYHWFAYGSSRNASILALAIYLSGGAILFLTLILAINAL